MRHRPARIDDLDQVYEIYMHASAIPYLGVDPMSKEDFKIVLLDLIAGGRFLAFENDGGIGGFINVIRLTARSGHVAKLGPLAIREELQGTGFASRMLTAVLDELSAEGIRRVELLVELDNPRAIKFYRRMGFDIEGRLRGAYRRSHEDADIDSYIMAKL